MNSNKLTTTQTTNLIGQHKFRDFLKLQTTYGFSQRGGVQYPSIKEEHLKRLVAPINLLSSLEKKHLVFSESIFSN